jgi:23S rRNA (cytidine1920-2'-O)/16S rRNA (cytidine1409-2'-O)-methyltransferase
MNGSTRIRLDEALVVRGLYPSRSRARDAILRGAVAVNGTTAAKPGQPIGKSDTLSLADPAQRYVSRAALKLSAGLDHFGLSVDGLEALDIGSSTGGFVQVLLERGAAHVTGIEVGHGQLHKSLGADMRVTNLEGLNARNLTSDHLPGRHIQVVTSDVSFISLKLALPPALNMAEPRAHCLLLVKPQFEAGREAIGRGGLLKDAKDGERIADELAQWLDAQPGWRSLGHCPSPIEGGDGNREYLLAGVKDQ